MDLFDAIQGRKSIRRFKQRSVPDEDIKKIIDAGRLAPSANNSQPWNFIVIKDRMILKKMADAVRGMVDRMVPFAENEKQAQRLAAYKSNYYVFFENAPVCIVVLMEADDASSDRLLRKMGYSADDVRRLRPLPGLQSMAAAIENVLLACQALGYGACWMTGPLVAQESFEKILRFGREQTAVALIPIGVSDEDPPTRARKPLEAIMRMIE
jgi:nitroreductase